MRWRTVLFVAFIVVVLPMLFAWWWLRAQERAAWVED